MQLGKEEFRSFWWLGRGGGGMGSNDHKWVTQVGRWGTRGAVFMRGGEGPGGILSAAGFGEKVSSKKERKILKSINCGQTSRRKNSATLTGRKKKTNRT